MTQPLPQAADREALPPVIKGSGFDRETGGFLFLIVNGRSFTAKEVAGALASQAKAGAPQPAGEAEPVAWQGSKYFDQGLGCVDPSGWSVWKEIPAYELAEWKSLAKFNPGMYLVRALYAHPTELRTKATDAAGEGKAAK